MSVTDAFAAVGDDRIHFPVGSFLVDMKQAELFDLCIDGEIKGLGVNGVTPGFCIFVFLRGVFSVVDQQIRPGSEIDVFAAGQTTGMNKPQLIVGQKNERFTVLDEFITAAAVGMTDGDGG